MHTTLAPAPARGTNTITLTVGLLPITLSTFTGTEETRVKRSEFFKGDPNISVGRSPVRKDTGEVISNDDVVRMALADNDVWVPLSDDEIADCTAPKGTADVEAFVPVKDMASYLAEGVLQVRPKREKGKANPATEKAFAVLLAGMRARKVCALVKVAMRGPARYALLTADGDLILVRTADQVRDRIPMTEVAYTKAEVTMVTNLIEAIGVDAPVITDDTAPVVQTYINAKAAGVAPAAKAAAPPVIVDVMGVLEASIVAAKAAKAA